MNYLSLGDLAAIVNILRSNIKQFEEDIPPFEQVDIHKLDSCLQQCYLEVFGESVNPTLKDKAVWLLYSIIKNHPFPNGNKRIAVYAYFEFLSRNVSDYVITESEMQHLMDLSVQIAQSPADEASRIREQIGFFFEYQMLSENEQMTVEGVLWHKDLP